MQTETEANKKCSELVMKHFKSRMKDIRTLVKYDQKGKEHPELGNLNEYGLCLDFVEAETFKDQREPFIRYQLSYGGPQEEFRIYLNGDVKFWFLNWFDGASVDVIGEDADIIHDIVSFLPEYEQVNR